MNKHHHFDLSGKRIGGEGTDVHEPVSMQTASGILIAVLMLVASHVLVFSAGLVALGPEESGRTLDALNWAQGEKVESVAWLPGQTVIIGTALKVWPDTLWAPRLVSLLFGVLVVAAIGWLSWELFSVHMIFVRTLVLAALFAGRVVLASTPLADVTYISLMIASMAALARWLRHGKTHWLFISAGVIAFAMLFRYEGWLFGVVLAGWLLVERLRGELPWRHAVPALLVLLVVPVGWLIHVALATGSPWTIFEPATPRGSQPDKSLLTLMLVNPFFQFVLQNLTSLNLAGFAGLALLTVNRKLVRMWAVVPTVAFGLYLALSSLDAMIPTHSYWRVSTPWSLLLVPFTGFVVHRIVMSIPADRRWMRRWISVLLLSLIAFHNMSLSVLYAHGHGYPALLRLMGSEEDAARGHAEFTLGRFIGEKLAPALREGERVFVETEEIDRKDLRFLHVLVGANSGGFIVRGDEAAGVIDRKRTTLVRQRARELGVRFFIVRSEPLKEDLKLHAWARRMRSFGDWTVFMHVDTDPERGDERNRPAPEGGAGRSET